MPHARSLLLALGAAAGCRSDRSEVEKRLGMPFPCGAAVRVARFQPSPDLGWVEWDAGLEAPPPALERY